MIGLLIRWVFRFGMAGMVARSMRARRQGAGAPAGAPALPAWARRIPRVNAWRVLRVARVTGHTVAALVFGALSVLATVTFMTLLLTGGPTSLTVASGAILAVALLVTAVQVRAVLGAGRNRLPAVP